MSKDVAAIIGIVVKALREESELQALDDSSSLRSKIDDGVAYAFEKLAYRIEIMVSDSVIDDETQSDQAE